MREILGNYYLLLSLTGFVHHSSADANVLENMRASQQNSAAAFFKINARSLSEETKINQKKTHKKGLVQLIQHNEILQKPP